MDTKLVIKASFLFFFSANEKKVTLIDIGLT